MGQYFHEFIEEFKKQKAAYLRSIKTDAHYKTFVRAELYEFLVWLQKRHQE